MPSALYVAACSTYAGRETTSCNDAVLAQRSVHVLEHDASANCHCRTLAARAAMRPEAVTDRDVVEVVREDLERLGCR